MLSLFWLLSNQPLSTRCSQNRDSKWFRINFSLIPLFYDHWAPSLTCFHTFWSLTCLHTSHFWSLFHFFKIENFFYHLVIDTYLCIYLYTFCISFIVSVTWLHTSHFPNSSELHRWLKVVKIIVNNKWWSVILFKVIVTTNSVINITIFM